MPIQLLNREKINDQWWKERIAAASCPMVYANSWYLDTVADGQWAALHCTDTGAVMPFAWKKRLRVFQQGYQPAFTQQLGVFGESPDADLIARFTHSLPGNMLLFSTHFNEHTHPPQSGIGVWKSYLNLVLPLDRSVEELRKGYSKSLRKRIRRGREALKVERSKDPALVSRYFHRQMESKVQMGAHNYALINRIMEVALERNSGVILLARDDNGDVQGACFFLIGFGRIINLFGSSDTNTNAMQLMLDEVISSYANSDYVFDFEGSEIPGVANFFRSFGSEERYYYRYDYSPIPGLAKWLQGR